MNNETVSVIISDLFEERLEDTILNVKNTAEGTVEILVKQDGDQKGMRYILNQLARCANGKYLFKLDGHCIMSPGWDTKLKAACGEKDMIVSRIKPIDNRTWTIKHGTGFGFVQMKSDLELIECGDFVPDDPEVAETMASIGCGFMVHRERFFELGANWLMLGRVGNLGAEWAFKIWLSGGRLLVHRDVICGHLFRRVNGLLTADQIRAARKILGTIFSLGMGPQQIHPMSWLSEKFSDVCKKTG